MLGEIILSVPNASSTQYSPAYFSHMILKTMIVSLS